MQNEPANPTIKLFIQHHPWRFLLSLREKQRDDTSIIAALSLPKGTMGAQAAELIQPGETYALQIEDLDLGDEEPYALAQLREKTATSDGYELNFRFSGPRTSTINYLQ